MITTKTKTCYGCGLEKVIWKNIIPEGEDRRKPYCQECCRSLQPAKPTVIPDKKKKIKPVSDIRAKRLKIYSILSEQYKKDHPECQARLIGCQILTEDIHHKKGKENDLLIQDEFFLAVCRSCHDWINTWSNEAIELGFSISRHHKAA